MPRNDYERIRQAIMFLDANYRRQPTLAEVAGEIGLSEFHFQRLFVRWAGVSPKRFVQYLTADLARKLLLESRTTLQVADDVGLSGAGRLHDLVVNVHAVTPGELAQRGDGLVIRFGVHPTPFGKCLLAATQRGICELWFVDKGDEPRGDLRKRWPNARIIEDQRTTGALVRRVFALQRDTDEPAMDVHVQGTNFQIKVWEALLRLPAGHVTTYGDIAAAIGNSKACRAVGSAVGKNPVAFLIPCHRVIQQLGAFGGYHWGPERKRAILAWEAARQTLAKDEGLPATADLRRGDSTR